MMTLLQFESQNVQATRLLRQKGKRRGFRKEEMNDADPAFTAVWSYYALLGLAIIGSLISFPELAKYSIYYGLWNLIPLGHLDGMKIFFGSILSWVILVFIYIVSLGLVIFL